MNDHTALTEFHQRSKAGDFKDSVLHFAKESANWGGCDKCHQSVAPENNVAIFDFILSGTTDWTIYFSSNRHLEPVVDHDGLVTCEGSPSRFQKISSLPDTRPDFAKFNNGGKIDEAYLAVWQWMQQELGNKPRVENGLISKAKER